MKILIHRFLFNLNYFFLWVGYFLISRAAFLLFYVNKTSELSSLEIFKTFTYGIKLDFSFAGYLCLIPFLIIIFSVWGLKKYSVSFIKGYTFPIIFIINLFVLIDLILYQSWGVRIDSTLLTYMNTPKIMLASVSTLHLIGGVLIWIVSSLAICFWFSKKINKSSRSLEKGKNGKSLFSSF